MHQQKILRTFSSDIWRGIMGIILRNYMSTPKRCTLCQGEKFCCIRCPPDKIM
jgi:hypothetical protein